jgi:hypothetical protein
MATTRNKRKLSQFQIMMGMPVNIQPSYIIHSISDAWKQSFARVQSNKCAISRHGWQPLNRGLLKSPEFLKTQVVTTEATTTSSTPPQEILPTAVITEPISPSYVTVLSNITNNNNSLSSTSTTILPKLST